MRKLTYSLACLVLLTCPILHAQTDLGTVDIGSSTTSTVTATILHSGVLATINVATGGQQNLDFTTTGGTCKVGSPVTAAGTCTIEVAFAPTLAGQRFGGFILKNQDGSVAAQGYLRGTGRGPQITYLPGTKTLLGQADITGGLATDSAGGLHQASPSINFASQDVPPGEGTTDESDVFVDGLGILFYPGTVQVYDFPAAIWAMQEEDASGNFYGPCAAGFCRQALQPDGTYVESSVTSDSNLTVLNVDGNGDIFATENDGMLHEFIAISGGYVPVAGSTGSLTISDLSTDALGNVYGIDSNGNVYKETPQPDGSAVQTYLFNNALPRYITNLQLFAVTSVGRHLLAADPAGNLYFWSYTDTNTYTSDVYPPQPPQAYPIYGLFEENYSLPSTLNFAVTAQNSVSGSQVVTITNSGNMPLQFSAIAFPADFKEGNSAGECTEGTSLVANASCTLTVQFAPVAALSAASAQLSEQVQITTNVHNAPGTQQAITVTGTESPSNLATISFSPATLTFPSTSPGKTSAPLTLTVSNTSAVAASVSSYKLTGPNAGEFSLLGKTCGYSLPAHSSCTLTYVFKPTVSGSATATLVATDNAFGAPQSVSITGTGTAAAVLSFTPGGLTFPATKVGAASAAQILTISNLSFSPMAVSSYTFSGTNASNFTLVSKTCSSLLAPGSTCTLSIAFRPTATGPASGNLVAVDSAGGSPQSAPLAGTGK